MSRRFEVEVTLLYEIEISDEIVALHADEKWSNDFYGMDTPEKIAAHLAWNCGVNNRYVNELDGFADRKREEVTVTEGDREYLVDDRVRL